MKRAGSKKLSLNRETLTALDLANVVGGNAVTVLPQTRTPGCGLTIPRGVCDPVRTKVFCPPQGQ